MQPPTHPVAGLRGRQSCQQILAGVGRTSQFAERLRPLQPPQRLLAEHASARVAGRHVDARREPAQRVGRPTRPQGRRAGLEPQQTVARIVAAQLRQHAQRIVPALLAVVEQGEGEAGLGPYRTRARGGLLDQLQAARPVAIHARHVRDHARREAEPGDDVPICPENESRVRVIGRERRRALRGLVGTPCRAERAAHPSLDRRGPRGLQAEGRAQVVMRTAIARQSRHPGLGKRDGLRQIALEVGRDGVRAPPPSARHGGRCVRGTRRRARSLG